MRSNYVWTFMPKTRNQYTIWDDAFCILNEFCMRSAKINFLKWKEHRKIKSLKFVFPLFLVSTVTPSRAATERNTKSGTHPVAQGNKYALYSLVILSVGVTMLSYGRLTVTHGEDGRMEIHTYILFHIV